MTSKPIRLLAGSFLLLNLDPFIKRTLTVVVVVEDLVLWFKWKFICRNQTKLNLKSQLD